MQGIDVHMLEIGALIFTPVLAFAGAWGGIRAKIQAFERELRETKEALRMDIEETRTDIRDVRADIARAHQRIDAVVAKHR